MIGFLATLTIAAAFLVMALVIVQFCNPVTRAPSAAKLLKDDVEHMRESVALRLWENSL